MKCLAVLFLLISSFIVERDYGPVRDKVDQIEFNNVYNPWDGKLRLTQIIFWDYNVDYDIYEVVDYRLLYNVPFFTIKREWDRIKFFDNASECFREIRTYDIIDTHTGVDTESEEKRKETFRGFKRRCLTAPHADVVPVHNEEFGRIKRRWLAILQSGLI